MERLSVWLGAGLLSTGLSVAVLTGVGVAAADDTPAGSDTGTSSGSETAPKPDRTSGPDTRPAAPRAATDRDSEAADEADESDPTEQTDKADKAEEADKIDRADDTGDADTADESEQPQDSAEDTAGPGDAADPDLMPASDDRKKRSHTTEALARTQTAPEPAAPVVIPEVQPVAEPIAATPLVTAAKTDTWDVAAARVAGAPTVSMAMAADTPAVEQASAPRIPNVARWVQGVVSNVVNGIGSIVINTIQALEALLTGPPAVPASSPVTVRTSNLVLANGQRVQANWYFPDVPEGQPEPDRLILLQHGFFALGPMYSHTAADLAIDTNSIVVTPTLPSNFFARDDAWLNGEGMFYNIAELFVGERTALNDSARAAGFTGVLPQKFGLAGHSAGGQLVAATAGYLVDNGAVDDLVGVITLDGVPTGNVMSVALRKLQAYEDATGRYIPVREIGAPGNLFNFISNVKQELNAARPGRFNGVVLTGGVHMDSMRGGNSIIQFAAFLIAGFPRPQNPPAVAQLSAAWFNDWFAGDTDNGDELVPGSTITITTGNGTATAVVVGAPAAITMSV